MHTTPEAEDLHLPAALLAGALLAGEWTIPEMQQRVAPLVIGSRKWLPAFVHRVVARFGHKRPRQRHLVDFILADLIFARDETAASRAAATNNESQHDAKPSFRIQPFCGRTQFASSDKRFESLDVPHWNTVGELAECLKLSPAELDWFADVKGLERVTPEGPLRHYRYRWVRKKGGSVRLIEAPKLRLKGIQRQLLRELFERIPIHEAAHGFRAGKSIQTFVQPHAGQRVVLKMDLRDFFPSLIPARLVGILMAIGYSESVARTITSLCVNQIPDDAWQTRPISTTQRETWLETNRYRQTHFPQGAPTSPCIANVIAYRLDCRLAGLARWSQASYTRYADDLLFSGRDEFRRKVDRLRTYVAAVALDEGFQVHYHKTRVMPSSQSQRAAGLVLNVRPNYPRGEYDLLKAVLHQASLSGPIPRDHAGHNDFRAHLLGRIHYVRQWNHARADKLLRLFERIEWLDAKS